VVIDFWVSIGSTYSALSVLRADRVAAEHGVRFRWRPVSVRQIMIEQNNITIRDKPVKAAYMWRDIARRAAMYGLTFKLPAPYPLPGLDLANRVALVGAQEDWGTAYTRATYRRWFSEGEPAGEEPNVSASIREAGADPARVLRLADTPEVDAAYRAATEEAKAAGVFGSPTFVVAGEVFWGDDRMEDAVSWARDGTLAKLEPNL
jgi:2-hydroxychromene-2-carboxylate isomerase